MRQYEAHEPFTERAVSALWKEIVGEPLARRTRPAKLRQSKLVVSVPSPDLEAAIMRTPGGDHQPAQPCAWHYNF